MEHSEIKDIVIKYLLNEATIDEQSTVIQWIESSKDHKAEFLELQALVDSIIVSTNPHKLNGEFAYQKIKERLDKKTGNLELPKKRKLMPILKIAAIFLIGFGLSWFAHNQVNRKIKESQSTAYQKVIVPYGSKTKLELPDGSHVTLNSGSTLKYPVQFDGDVRNVYLEGEGYFDVKKDKSHPFFVNTSGIHIRVLGTSFNVKSYPEEKTVETTLISGSVQIFSDKGDKGRETPVLLKPNQKAVYLKTGNWSVSTSKTVTKKEDQQKVNDPIKVENDIKTEQLTAWKDNRLEFDNELFHEVIIKMERWYNVEIKIDNKALYQARLSGKFDKENVEQALKALIVVSPFHYDIDKNKINIY